MDYEPVIGLEVHLQLRTVTKLFCGCLTKFGAAPNSQTCPVCLGLPGALPVLNQQALEWGIRTALAFQCEIAQVMKFDRKQYFYPDLPKNYQISQYDRPLAQHGHLDIVVGPSLPSHPAGGHGRGGDVVRVGGMSPQLERGCSDATGMPVGLHSGSREAQTGDQATRIGIRRIHMEEDAGKLLHEASVTESFLDFNRVGVPLLEIVSEPDLRSSDEAYQYLGELKAILEYLDVSSCNMEEGSLRCDTNVSLRARGSTVLGSKVEVKNLNSFRGVKLALEYEMRRQTLALDRGERIAQETRLWDAKEGKTQSMRSKEEAADYRYFPEPDLVPFTIDRQLIVRAQASLPELPAERRKRFQASYQLGAYDAHVLTQHRRLAALFEGALSLGAAPKPIANWIMGDLLGYLNAHGLEPDAISTNPDQGGQAAVKVRPEWLAHLVELIGTGTISGKMAKDVFIQMLERRVDPAELVSELGLRQIVDREALERIAEEVLATNAKSVDAYLKGKTNALTYLMGQAMKCSQGKANPQQMTELLKQKLAALKLKA